MSKKLSYHFVPMPIRVLRSDLTSSAKLVYLHLFSFNPCFPSYKTLKLLTGYGAATIKRAQEELVKANILTVNRGSFKSRKANRYLFNDRQDEWILSVSILFRNEDRGEEVCSRLTTDTISVPNRSHIDSIWNYKYIERPSSSKGEKEGASLSLEKALNDDPGNPLFASLKQEMSITPKGESD